VRGLPARGRVCWGWTEFAPALDKARTGVEREPARIPAHSFTLERRACSGRCDRWASNIC